MLLLSTGFTQGNYNHQIGTRSGTVPGHTIFFLKFDSTSGLFS